MARLNAFFDKHLANYGQCCLTYQWPPIINLDTYLGYSSYEIEISNEKILPFHDSQK